MKKDSILVERTFNVPASKVWSALTDISDMKQWYFDIEKFEPKVGFKFDFMGGPNEDTQYLHLCEVTEVIENEKLAYTWRYDNYPGNSLVCWQLIDRGEKTIVRLTHTDIPSLAEGSPDFSKENFSEGWNYILHTSLKEYLENDES
ncbi:SRPBCC family protein [Pedobacter sp. SL55]|uniref:SRPBCC family protein n=1 Tax=Pedobacter sp. SL55 TaxID=2995161 RepID=UPI00227058A6|nr:SRPBCC domain-containing protein [Pedobacter sp. SL55]WAC40697.1 SRPBCC domain-containing protein [Pedobacter sp. SL55]